LINQFKSALCELVQASVLPAWLAPGFRAAGSTLAWCGWLSSSALAKTFVLSFSCFKDTQGRSAHVRIIRSLCILNIAKSHYRQQDHRNRLELVI